MPLSPKLRGHLAPAAQSQTKVNPLGERGALDRHEAHFHSTLFPKRSRHRHGRFALRYGRPLEQRTVGRNLILGHAYGEIVARTAAEGAAIEATRVPTQEICVWNPMLSVQNCSLPSGEGYLASQEFRNVAGDLANLEPRS
jgi:hypothetical protein